MISLPEIKKLVISTVLFLFLLTNFLFVFASSVYAQAAPASAPGSTWYNQDFKSWFNKVYDSPQNDVFGERYTAAQVQWIVYGLFAYVFNSITGDPKMTSCVLSGKSLQQCKVEQFFNSVIDQLKKALPKLPGSSYSGNSILGYIFLEDRPLSGITYFRDVGRNWHLIPEANAQTPGFGFNALNPVLPLWRASRNVAYGLLVFAIIALSFMIMFRVKINPQTVVTVQSAIPKVVLALILITFSYAIAGFMVDLMYVFIGLLALILSGAYSGFGVDPGFFSTSAKGLFDYMTVGPWGLGIFGAMIFYSVFFGVGAFISLLGASGVAGIITTAVVTVVSLVTPLGFVTFTLMGLVLIVLFIVLLWAVIKTIWILFKAFAISVLLVAVGPLQIALGIVVPGIGFGTWLKSFAANLAVFPTAGLFVSLAFLFLFLAVKTILPNLPFVGGGAPQPTPGWPPLLSIGTTATQSIIYLILSLTFLLILPKVADIIKAMIEGKPFESGIGQALGSVRTVGTGGLQYFASSMEAGQQRAFYTQFPGARTAPPVAWVNALRRLGLIK